LIQEWLRKQAYANFDSAIKKIYMLILNMITHEPDFEVKRMAKRWGSCLRKKNMILLNSELIKAPMHCIEYVVLHEMLHFQYKGHTKEFYNKLTILMPDWKYRKEILDEEIVLFI
jgi:predicted metal-dependent hydrolase